MPDFDVAVVGAGPSGSWAAYRLARAGARVALIDGTHPREKPCGGGVTGHAFALVREALPATLAGVEVRSATFMHGADEARVSLDRHSNRLLRVFPRQQFDEALHTAALNAGAEPMRAQATHLESGSQGWMIRLRERVIRARRVIGADGANSLVRRRVAQPFARPQISIAAGYYVPRNASNEIVIGFEDNPPGYIWSFPRPDHLAVGICAQADVSSSAALLSRSAAWIERHLGVPVAGLRRYSWPIPSLNAAALARERPAGDGWMLIGDAAGFVDPITREGILFALRSADAAAACLLAEGDAVRSYTQALRNSILSELTKASRLKHLFFQPRFTSLLLEALRNSHSVREVMTDLLVGHQTYRGLRRRLLATCEFGVMFDLLRARA